MAIQEAYTRHDLDLQELISGAQKQWEERDKTPAPDLALMTKADIHGRQSEQRFGRDTLVATQASLLKATGETTISDDSRQYLMMSVSIFGERSRVHYPSLVWLNAPECALYLSSYSGIFLFRPCVTFN